MLPNTPTGVKTRQDQKIINFPRAWREVSLKRVAGTTTFKVIGGDTAASPLPEQQYPHSRVIRFRRTPNGKVLMLGVQGV